MMSAIRLRQHIPTFHVDGSEYQADTVIGLDEMLALPWIKQWEADPGFDHWSCSDRYLMAEMTDGSYWVVAIVLDGRDGMAAALPRWEERESPAMLRPPWAVESAVDQAWLKLRKRV